MSKIKATVGGLFAFGVPAAFAVLFAALGYRYSGQHVHDVWAELRGPHHAAVVVNDYHHSGGGIAAVAAALGIAWVAVSTLFVLMGGKMIDARNRRWNV